MDSSRVLFRILFCIGVFAGTGLSFGDRNGNQLKECDLARPETFEMPEVLKEISGIALDKGKNDVIYAVQDEVGQVFKLTWQNQKFQRTKFAGTGDFEDITTLKEQLINLKSNGTLYSLPVSETHSDEAVKTKEWKNLLPKGEYEAVFGDELTGKIYVLCKACAIDVSGEKVSGFILNAGNTIQNAGHFSLDVQQIRAMNVKVKKGFQPSALARNPLSGDWYILSSVNKALVVTDNKWKPKSAYLLGGNRFGQPEGIAFDKSGNLYISNEGNKTSAGNILKFKRLNK